MADPTEKPSPAPLTLSRGVRLVLLACSPIVFAIVLAELAVFVLIIRRDVTPVIGIGLMFGGILTPAFSIVPMVKSVVEGWTRQDEAKIAASAPKTEAPTATATTNVVVPSKEG